jgi:hypothetical protein
MRRFCHQARRVSPRSGPERGYRMGLAGAKAIRRIDRDAWAGAHVVGGGVLFRDSGTDTLFREARDGRIEVSVPEAHVEVRLHVQTHRATPTCLQLQTRWRIPTCRDRELRASWRTTATASWASMSSRAAAPKRWVESLRSGVVGSIVTGSWWNPWPGQGRRSAGWRLK